MYPFSYQEQERFAQCSSNEESFKQLSEDLNHKKKLGWELELLGS